MLTIRGRMARKSYLAWTVCPHLGFRYINRFDDDVCGDCHAPVGR